MPNLRSLTALDSPQSSCVTGMQSRQPGRIHQGCHPVRAQGCQHYGAKAPTWALPTVRATVRFGMASIRVVLAEDNALLREGIARIIDGEPDFDLVGRAADLPELLELIEDTSPDVVVTDIRMPPTGTDEGIQAASWLREHKPEVGVVVLSQYKTPSYALALLETGSAGRAYLLKEQVAGADELAQAIRTVAQSGSMIDPQIVDELIEAKSSRRKSDLSWLTPRESEILGEMAKGKSNAAIAACPAGLGAGGGEAHQLHLLQAGPDRGARRKPAGQGGARLSERSRRRVTPPPRGVAPPRSAHPTPCENGRDERSAPRPDRRRPGTVQSGHEGGAEAGRRVRAGGRGRQRDRGGSPRARSSVRRWS